MRRIIGGKTAKGDHMGNPGLNHCRNGAALAGLRIAVGVLFLIFAEYKLLGTKFTLGGGFQYWIRSFLSQGAAYPFMVPVLTRFVLPNATAIAFFAAYSEFAIGLALTFGVLVRVASIGGAVYMLTLLFSSNYPGADAPFWEYFGASLDHLVLAMCFVTFACSDAGNVWSIRPWLQRFQRSR